MRVHVTKIKTYHADTIQRAIQIHSSLFFQQVKRVPHQFTLMSLHVLHPNRLKIVNRCAKSYHSRNIRSSGFKLPWNLIPRSALERNLLYHVTATKNRLHMSEKLKLPIQNTDVRTI